jgi:hypothetical protein
LRGILYRRPVLILKKFNRHGFLGIPLSSAKKVDSYIICIGEIDNMIAYANVSQTRSFSSRRLGLRVQSISRKQLFEIRKIAREILFSDDSRIDPSTLEGEPGWPTEK